MMDRKQLIEVAKRELEACQMYVELHRMDIQKELNTVYVGDGRAEGEARGLERIAAKASRAAHFVVGAHNLEHFIKELEKEEA